MDKRSVVAIVPTRGNVDIEPIVKQFSHEEDMLYIADNREGPVDFKVFARFAATPMVGFPQWLMYTQDDDCIVPRYRELIDQWQPGEILCNMAPEFQKAYSGRPFRLLGHGSVFDAELVRPTFDRYLKHFPLDDLFLIECDRIFTGLNLESCRMVYVGHENTKDAAGAVIGMGSDRLWTQPDHAARAAEVQRRIFEVLKAEAQAK